MDDISRLRYSPVNGLVLNWSYNGVPFSTCGMPKPIEESCKAKPELFCCSGVAPLPELVDTYGWYRWLPEVCIGIDQPNEEIAANYVREVAIDFSKRSQVLQRKLYINVDKCNSVYPLETPTDESIIGVLAVVDNTKRCWFKWTSGDFVFNRARQEIEIPRAPNLCGVLEVIVWASPSESACEHDAVLYDMYREPIAYEARRRYVMANHFRDKVLVSSLLTNSQYSNEILKARKDSLFWILPPRKTIRRGLF